MFDHKMLVMSLKRLYKAGRLTAEQLAEREEKGSVTPEEHAFIVEE
jgi:hypothetical protein